MHYLFGKMYHINPINLTKASTNKLANEKCAFKNNNNNNDFKICPLSTQFKKLQLN